MAGTESIAANLLDAEATMKAVAGSDMVYLLVGIEYKHTVWQRDWPIIMRNVINACKAAGAPLIFFDNVYQIIQTLGSVVCDHLRLAHEMAIGIV